MICYSNHQGITDPWVKILLRCHDQAKISQLSGNDTECYALATHQLIAAHREYMEARERKDLDALRLMRYLLKQAFLNVIREDVKTRVLDEMDRAARCEISVHFEEDPTCKSWPDVGVVSPNVILNMCLDIMCKTTAASIKLRQRYFPSLPLDQNVNYELRPFIQRGGNGWGAGPQEGPPKAPALWTPGGAS